MSHPAASVKSIFSGKVNLTDTDLDEISTYKGSSCGSSSDFPITYQDRVTVNVDRSSLDGDLLSENNMLLPSAKSPDSDNYSVTSRNLRLMALQKPSAGVGFPNSSTNVSLASTSSDYQQAFAVEDEYSSDSSQPEVFVSESFSRPMSRNSTTSCLSTTATKDGVEGKKLHRHGPTPYFSNVIANMISHQHLNPAVSRLELELSHAATSTELEAMALPPVTLSEKIRMLNADSPRK